MRFAPTILATIALALTLGFLAGCENTHAGKLTGPQVTQPVRIEAWEYHGKPARTFITPHYAIHTTIENTETVNHIAQVMEGGYVQYQAMVPTITPSNRPMDCYMFANRREWAFFTREHTGNDAKVYLQINKGGYTVRDWYVSYLGSDQGTYAVAAHEGWHQFVSRNFKSRLPAFLEEGIATQFENISWAGDLPRWNQQVNGARAQRLRQASEGKYLWPLDKLITMHAGDVVGLGGEQIESFYAQDWAFIRFLMDGQNGKYRERFQKFLTDAANGTLWDPSGDRHPVVSGWNPAAVKPVLEHYLGADLNSIDADYQAYIKVIAFDKFNDQFRQGG